MNCTKIGTMLCLLCLCLWLPAAERLVDAPSASAFVWPSQPPKDCPFPLSKTLTGIQFTSRHSDYKCGDTWYPSWAADGNQYSPWTDGTTDGVGSSSGGAGAHTGNGVMIGDDPLKLSIRNTSLTQPASPRPYEGRYPCGSLVYNGIWYYGTYCLGETGGQKHNGFTWNWPILGPMPGFRISRDYGKTWTPSPLSPTNALFPEPAAYLGPVKMGAPHFVDFGRNMQHSPDGKAYLVGMGAEEGDAKPRPCIVSDGRGGVRMVTSCTSSFAHANLSWITADQAYLARVKPSPETINRTNAYEFFAGLAAKGVPVWTNDFSLIRPIAEWNNNMGCVTITYNAPLKIYLMCVTDGWPTVAKMNSYILESDAMTGPWRLVTYMKDFGEQAYFLNFPSKFISKDGRTLWLCYSANFSPGWNGVALKLNPPGGRYGLCLHEVRLLGPGTAASPVKNYLDDPANVAPAASIDVSSTSQGYSKAGLTDRVISGFPGTTAGEWASRGERISAWIYLKWSTPVVIDRVCLFDRPNTTDQILRGTLTFSDGSRLEVATPLPDTAQQGVEITFPQRAVRWLKFVPTEMKDTTGNVGLSEIAVFTVEQNKGK